MKLKYILPLFTDRQLEIIAYSVALIESDFDGKTQAEMHQIIGILQEEGIWGSIETFHALEEED